jgi:hypothetical protein
LLFQGLRNGVFDRTHELGERDYMGALIEHVFLSAVVPVIFHCPSFQTAVSWHVDLHRVALCFAPAGTTSVLSALPTGAW